MKILKNYLYNATYQVIAIIIPLITVPYISRILGSEAVGINSYTSSIMTYFVLFANLGMTVYGNRTIAYYRDSLEERSKKFWEIVVIKLIMGFLSFVSLLIFINFYTSYSYFLILQSIQIIATTLDISWFFVGMEEFKKTVTRNIIVKIISTISIFSFVHSRNDLGIYILLVAVSTLLGNLTLWSYVKYYITLISFRNLKLKGHLFPILVLFIPQLANSIFMTMNNLVLGNLSTLSQTGYFDNSDKVVRILLAFITAIGTVIFPRIANSFAKKDHQSVEKYLTLAFNVVNLVSFPIVAGVIAISHPFSSIYFGSNFDGIDLILSILVFELIFMGWSSIIGNQFLVAINKPTGLTISVFISVIISLGVSFVLVPIFGASGAAVSAVTGEFIIAIIQLMVVRKYINIFKLFSDIPFYFFSSLLMFLASIFVSHFVTGNLFTVLVQIVTGVTVYSLLIFMFKPKSIQEILSALFLKISLK
ncbi:hypothetical protein LLT5_02330 [Lactococcus cremoris subsp. cremoris TIFN5]|nr:hypothetical protein LLT5_02330 [Lactococcus cremoris subsp. cremoris TIFN5]EQC82199.1 hypothetical protein LLT1_00735 [Lactococcus cremoris subsp. cremoris TIFN1]EQC82215.1 hypothetical protein LLT1_15380 [Lactococcus cremoris subsp. cremoris TIFN1]